MHTYIHNTQVWTHTRTTYGTSSTTHTHLHPPSPSQPTIERGSSGSRKPLVRMPKPHVKMSSRQTPCHPYTAPEVRLVHAETEYIQEVHIRRELVDGTLQEPYRRVVAHRPPYLVSAVGTLRIASGNLKPPRGVRSDLADDQWVTAVFIKSGSELLTGFFVHRVRRRTHR